MLLPSPLQLLMVMEYCEAGALVGPGTLTPERHLPEAMAQYYFRQMASGLAYLHENHVVRSRTAHVRRTPHCALRGGQEAGLMAWCWRGQDRQLSRSAPCRAVTTRPHAFLPPSPSGSRRREA